MFEIDCMNWHAPICVNMHQIASAHGRRHLKSVSIAGVGAAVTGAGAGAGVGFPGLLITVSSQVPTTGIREMYESA